MRTFLKTKLTLILLLISVVSFAGDNPDKIKADQAFEKGYFNEAIDYYNKAYGKIKELEIKSEVAFKIGECYRYMADFKKATQYYEKALRTNLAPKLTYLRLAQVLQHEEDYDGALEAYEEYFVSNPEDERGKLGVESCLLSKEWKENPTRYEVELEKFNSEHSDYAPVMINKKEKSVVFTSTRPSGSGSSESVFNGEFYSDLFIIQQDNKGTWSEPSPYSNVINTEFDEATAVLTNNGNIIYFTRCPQVKKEGLGCAIYSAKKESQTWLTPEEVKGLRPSDSVSVSVQHPMLSEDNKTLYYVSDIHSEYSKGGFDIWYVEWDETKKTWGEPKNAGGKINTSHNEAFPYVNGNELYFSSNGHPGMGGLDIFKTIKNEDGTWSQVENLKYPLNSSYDDFGIMFTEKGTFETGLFTSNRGTGYDNIYKFILPELVYDLVVTIKDKDTKEILPNVKITIQGVSGNDNNLYSALTNESGMYNFTNIENSEERYIKPESNYEVTIERTDIEGAPKVLTEAKSITTLGVGENKTFYLDFEVAVVGKPISMPDILYDLDKAKLQANDSVNAADSLNYIYDLMVKNPTTIIQIESHTDSRGDKNYNQRLSQRRAQTVVDYLINEKGIAPERLKAVGYGEEKLKITDEIINALGSKNAKEKLHAKNRRTEFSVLSWDYVPTDLIDEETDKIEDERLDSEETEIEEVNSEEITK